MDLLKKSTLVFRVDTGATYRILFIDPAFDLIAVLPIRGRGVAPQLQSLAKWSELQDEGLLLPDEDVRDSLPNDILPEAVALNQTGSSRT